MHMATPHPRFIVRLIQWRRHYARRRTARDLGWRTGWER